MAVVDTKAIRARAEKATPGSWDLYPAYNGDAKCSGIVVCWKCTRDGCEVEHVNVVVAHSKNDDAAFIAAARADVPALCDEVDRLREALKWFEGAKRMLGDR